MPPCLIKICKVIIPLRFFPLVRETLCLAGFFFSGSGSVTLFLQFRVIFFLLIVIGHVT